MQKIAVVILAAGQGTRMRSVLPKVLHTVGHKPMLEHVYDTARAAGAHDIHIVYGFGGHQVRERLAALDAQWVLQAEQRGTGHAVEQALPAIDDDEIVLILYGDVPLVRAATLRHLMSKVSAHGMALMTATLADATGYGRIVRDENGVVQRIVEHKDATQEELTIREVNTGMMAVDAVHLKKWIAALDNDNSQGEFYLTDIIEMAVAEDVRISTIEPSSVDEILGVNNRMQLAEIERHYQLRQARALMEHGVTLRDPARIDVRGTITTGQDVEIDVNVVFDGHVVIGSRVLIGANCIIKDAVIEDDVVIEPHSIIEKSLLGRRAHIGPFARIRPETQLGEDAKIGNFVEVKKAKIGAGSKINHLSYIGDALIGKDVNVGAGTITCNYDGANKHQTVIGDNAFIGSDTQLVAPVEVGAGATIGAGSTICKNAPANQLTLSRAPQKSVENWQRPKKK